MSYIRQKVGGYVRVVIFEGGGMSEWGNVQGEMSVSRLDTPYLECCIRPGRLQFWYSIKIFHDPIYPNFHCIFCFIECSLCP